MSFNIALIFPTALSTIVHSRRLECMLTQKIFKINIIIHQKYDIKTKYFFNIENQTIFLFWFTKSKLPEILDLFIYNIESLRILGNLIKGLCINATDNELLIINVSSNWNQPKVSACIEFWIFNFKWHTRNDIYSICRTHIVYRHHEMFGVLSNFLDHFVHCGMCFCRTNPLAHDGRNERRVYSYFCGISTRARRLLGVCTNNTCNGKTIFFLSQCQCDVSHSWSLSCEIHFVAWIVFEYPRMATFL